ncbi:MAG: CidA/LrgA family protein [Gammaproteobacteria bacterium]|nr:CidA/LrgA family protein [Gammaproteobacteria bacterium]
MTDGGDGRGDASPDGGREPPGQAVLAGITLLLCYQLVGETIVRALGLPLPGPVLGMLLLLLTLVWTRGVAGRVEGVAETLLGHLSLLFVPAGVGVMVHGQRLGGEWLPIVAALVASTLLTLLAVAFTMRLMVRWLHLGEDDDAAR